MHNWNQTGRKGPPMEFEADSGVHAIKARPRAVELYKSRNSRTEWHNDSGWHRGRRA
jgi:hypothetical protein